MTIISNFIFHPIKWNILFFFCLLNPQIQKFACGFQLNTQEIKIRRCIVHSSHREGGDLFSRPKFWNIQTENAVPIGEMPLFAISGSCFKFDAHSPHIFREDIEGLDDVFMIHGVLSKLECEEIIALTEQMGYSDFDAGKNTHGALTVVMDQEGIIDPIFKRCQSFLPQTLMKSGKEKTLLGLNARFRFYKYKSNGVDEFRPHVDDSFPGTGLSEDKQTMIWDVYGDRSSMLSFLLYLNDDISGGFTTFYPQGLNGSKIAITPQQGAVLCFFQTFSLDGAEPENMNAPLHEGSSVFTEGSLEKQRGKYIIRSDVLYTK